MISNKNIRKMNTILKEIDILEQKQIYIFSSKHIFDYYFNYQTEVIINNNLIAKLKLKANKLYISTK